ncbi:lipopolysaccharide biosynthesis protein [Alkalicoccobacillus plakortidis]|uniref:Oligosaccharide flippase family protein n=1 Tax=Alkalicoccobacillus plakortidis TaxID=444060 RepID=A0ABT0XJK2_9BACI|nr:oligosaccharide flippase family protein [Alkalicoccobacillus plakortidis]MCM2675910.1 oligosaccharide flippase family protein [Alkalicoccobacillus plakortidis]
MEQIKKLFRKLKSKSIIKNIVVLVSGTMAAQVITLLTTPLITRLFGPEIIGELGTFTSITEIIIPIAALAYPIAIVLPKHDIVAIKLIKLSVVIALILSVISLMLILILNSINLFDGMDTLNIALYFIPLVIIFSSLLQVSEQWLIRKKAFYITAKTNFLYSSLFNTSKIVLGLINPVSIGLIVVTTLGQLLKATMLSLNNKNNIINSYRIYTGNNEISIWLVGKKYKDFALFRSPQMLLHATSLSLPVLLLLNFFGPAAVGFYTISRTALNAPIQLIGKAVGDVFYPRISEAANNQENLYKLIYKATLLLGCVGIIPFSIIIIFGPTIFEFAFGHDWTKAGSYSQWMAIWMFFLFINQPSIRALPVLKAQKFHLVFTFFSLIVNTLGIVISYHYFKSDIISVAVFSLTGSLSNILLIIITLVISKNIKRGFLE